MKVMLVEDDSTQAGMIVDELRAIDDLQIERLSTEKEFRSRLDQICEEPPDLFIIDIMLRWTDVSRDVDTPPAEVRNGKFHRAGFRCEKLLQQRQETHDIPVILHSVVDFAEFTRECSELGPTVCLRSKAEPGLATLVRRLLGGGTTPGR